MKGEVAFETLAWRLRMISEVTKATREFFPSYVQIDWRIVLWKNLHRKSKVLDGGWKSNETTIFLLFLLMFLVAMIACFAKAFIIVFVVCESDVKAKIHAIS